MSTRFLVGGKTLELLNLATREIKPRVSTYFTNQAGYSNNGRTCRARTDDQGIMVGWVGF